MILGRPLQLWSHANQMHAQMGDQTPFGASLHEQRQQRERQSGVGSRLLCGNCVTYELRNELRPRADKPSLVVEGKVVDLHTKCDIIGPLYSPLLSLSLSLTLVALS